MTSPARLGARRRPGAALPDRLTDREREVAALTALGYTNSEVAKLLRIHAKTVETHRKHVMDKAGLKSRAELVSFALAHGLVAKGPGGAFFHFCAACRVLWARHGQFLSDPEVTLLGYQPGEALSAPGLFRFRHSRCGQRLEVDLNSLARLTGEPVMGESCATRGVREAYCLASPGSCPVVCVCAFVSRASAVIGGWPKSYNRD